MMEKEKNVCVKDWSHFTLISEELAIVKALVKVTVYLGQIHSSIYMEKMHAIWPAFWVECFYELFEHWMWTYCEWCILNAFHK